MQPANFSTITVHAAWEWVLFFGYTALREQLASDATITGFNSCHPVRLFSASKIQLSIHEMMQLDIISVQALWCMVPGCQEYYRTKDTALYNWNIGKSEPNFTSIYGSRLNIHSLQTYDSFMVKVDCLESIGFPGSESRWINRFHPVKYKENKGHGSEYADKHKQHCLGDDQFIDLNLLENLKN